MRKRLLPLLAFFVAAAALGQDHPNLGRGFAADKLYDFLGLDTVNDFNGNLVIRVPIGQEYVSNGLVRYRFMLSYNSSIWEYMYSPDGTQLTATPTLLSNAGAGWRLSLGSLLPPIGDSDYAANPGNNTANWAYVDPTSARHGFRTTLHDADTADTYHWYTRDNTYIRMTQVDAGTRNVELPDGTRQVFKKYQLPAGNGSWTRTWQGTKWRLWSIEDGFGSHVTIDYETTSDQTTTYPEVWHVHDGGRQHDVYFVNASSYYDLVLDHVVLNTLGNTTATYRMQYQELTAQVTGAGDNSVTYRTFPVLTTISLPDSTSYSMISGSVPQYDTGTTTGTPGVITAMQLPTTGKISWTYDQLDLEDGTWGRPANATQKPSPPAAYTRTLSDNTGTRGTWTFNRMASNGGLTCPCSNPYGCPAHARQMTTWTSKPDGTTNIGYFSIYHSGDGCVAGVWSGADYGIPGTPQTTSGNGRLSTERRSSFSGPPASWTGLGGFQDPTTSDLLWAKQYTRYDGEAYISGGVVSYDRNLRPFYFKNTYDGDSDCSGCFFETSLFGFDGYGHYRQKSVNGNVPGTPYRTTFTNYPGTLDANLDWVLETPTETCVADEGAARTTTVDQCGDLNGFTAALNYDRAKGVEIGRRVLNSSSATATLNDLLTIREFDNRGNITTEKFWGGDTQTLTNTSPLFSESQTPTYEIHHYPTYNVAGNLVGRRSVYRNVPGTGDFNAPLEDTVIDAYTGAVTTSRDSAGVATAYAYDNMGRLTAATPTGLAATSVSYTTASLSGTILTPATATVTTTSSTAGSLQDVYMYDAFGRISHERMLMPDGTWSRVQNTYNGNGQVAAVTTQQSENAGCWTSASGCPATSYLYDANEQARLITAPDSSTTTVTRYGAGRSDTTVRNAAGTTNLFRTDRTDGLGRLRTVLEKSGPTSSAQTTGSDVTTTYGYDTQDHLATVHMASSQTFQNRSFSYDQRGLLTAESHPESGSTYYGSYDAKGHVGRRITGSSGGTFDLMYTYDGAERLTSVKDLDSIGNRRPLKQFTFADANSGSNYLRGKLSTAERTNHLTVGDVVVTESYTYSGPGGALYQKDTSVTVAGSPFQTFSQTYTYNDLGAATGVGYPVCATATPCSTTGGIGTLPRSFTNGRLTEVGTGLPGAPTAYGSITYSPNGMVNEVTHPGNVIDTFAADSTGLARPTSIRFHGFSTCSSVTITPGASSMCTGASQTASATVVSGATYAWTIDNGTITAGASTSTVTFTAGSNGSTTTLHVTVTNGGCTTTTSASVSVTSSVTITQQPTAVPSTPIAPHQTALVSVGASGSTLTYQWYRGAKSDTTNPVAGANGPSFTTPPLTVTTTYWVRVGSSCGSVDSEIVTVIVTLAAPSSVSATTQATTTQVLVQWSSVADASSYLVEYAANIQGPFNPIGPATTALYATHMVTPGSVPVAYVYRVRSVDSAGNASSAVSPMDYAVTGSALFTNEPIQKRVTLIYARHVGELRKAIDALRAAATTPQAPLPPAWQNASDPTGVISASAITSLFVPFNQARHAFGFADFAYTAGIAVPQANVLILSEHVQQIRDALR